MEILKEVFRSLYANKLRTFLSMLGIVIGVAAVVMVMALGAGAKKEITEKLTSLGSNVILVLPGFTTGRGGTVLQAVETLRESDVKAILNMCPSVDRAIGLIEDYFAVLYKKNDVLFRVCAVPIEIFQILNLKVSKGRTFSEDDMNKNVILIGQEAAYSLFKGEDPLGKKVYIVQKDNVPESRKIPFEVIGVLERTGGILMFNPDGMILVPYEMGKYRLFQSRGEVSMIIATTPSPELSSKAAMEIDHLLYKKFHGKEDLYSVLSQQAILSVITETMNIVSFVLTAIAAISLVVGGIGIMNIMLVSVVERTREIGIKMALGASRTRILMEFLVESVTITFVAGVIGLLLAALGSSAVNIFGKTFGIAAVIEMTSVLLAFGVSTGIGLFFGFYPAYRASRLSPIEALRYE